MQPQTQKLPSYTLYRSHCHSSLDNYLCYLSSTVEIRLVEFSSLSDVMSSTVIKIPQEPVKGICIHGYDHVLYIGVAFVSRYIVYTKEGENVFSSILPLDQNISIYREGYFGVERWWMGGAVSGLVFGRTNGELKVFDVKERKEILKIPQSRQDEFYTSMAIYEEILYLGRDDGKIQRHQLTEQSCYQMQALDATTSQYPIVNLLYDPIRQQLFATTFEGELLIYSQNLQQKSLIFAHHSNISRLHLGYGSQVYTCGEDGLVHTFEIIEKRNLKPVKTRNDGKLVSLLFSINKKNCLVYYEDPKIIFI